MARAFDTAWAVVKNDRKPICCDSCSTALYDEGAFRSAEDPFGEAEYDVIELASVLGEHIADHDCEEVQKEYYELEEHYEAHRCVCSCH